MKVDLNGFPGLRRKQTPKRPEHQECAGQSTGRGVNLKKRVTEGFSNTETETERQRQGDTERSSKQDQGS